MCRTICTIVKDVQNVNVNVNVELIKDVLAELYAKMQKICAELCKDGTICVDVPCVTSKKNQQKPENQKLATGTICTKDGRN